MQIIETIAPISIDNLKKYFADKNIKFVIDYKNSALKGSKLLIYLSNLDVPVDIDINETSEEFYPLLKDYLESSFILDVKLLEVSAIKVMLASRNLLENLREPEENKQKLVAFIEENTELIKEWSSRLDSLTLYNFYTIKDVQFKEFVENYPNGESTTKGINFVSLLKHEDFYSFYEAVDVSNLKFYKDYFNEYIFKGKNLFSYWANENNPLFLLTFGISEGLVHYDKENNSIEVLQTESE
jgi:hypothetical protein